MAQIKTLPPIKAIRAFCIQCEGDNYKAIANCLDHNCPIRAYRFGKTPPPPAATPLATIKKYCLDYCRGGSCVEEVVNCQGDKPLLESFDPCPLYPYRRGKNPNIKSATREKRKQAALKRAVKGSKGFSKRTQHGATDPSSFNGNSRS